MSYYNLTKGVEQEIFLPEDAVDIMKWLTPKQLVNILLPDDDWYGMLLETDFIFCQHAFIAELRRPKAAKRSPIPILGN